MDEDERDADVGEDVKMSGARGCGRDADAEVNDVDACENEGAKWTGVALPSPDPFPALCHAPVHLAPLRRVVFSSSHSCLAPHSHRC